MSTRHRGGTKTMTTKPVPLSDDETSPEVSKAVPLVENIPLRRSQSFPNLSVNFADGYAFWLYYLVIIFLCWYSLFVFPIPQFWPALTIINICHGVVTFYLMHWRRGTPDAFDQGRDDNYTFWEMLNEGAQYTPSRKFFQIVPIILFLMACYECEWRKRYYFANLVALSFCLVPKAEFMMGIRIFGLNIGSKQK